MKSRRLVSAAILLLLPSAAAAHAAAAPGAAKAATAVTYYFHGTAQDDANRANGTPSATFDRSVPTGTSDVTQTTATSGNAGFAGNPLGVYWISSSFQGLLNGDVQLDWWWSTGNAESAVVGSEATVTLFADADVAAGTGTKLGQVVTTLNLGPTATENHTVVPNVSGAVHTNLVIQVTPDFSDEGVANVAHYDSTSAPSSAVLPYAGALPPPPDEGSGPGGTYTAGQPWFANYEEPQPPAHSPHNPPTGARFLIGEPSVGVDWVTGKAMYLADLSTYAVGFDDTKAPPAATWTDASFPTTDNGSLDPILITDHTGAQRGTGDRTIVAQLAGIQSSAAFTDNDGQSPADWTPMQGGGLPSGPDHESIGAGPYRGTPPTPSTYPHAVYYCSQAELLTNQPGPIAFCSRSDTGGLTWNSGVQAYAQSQCGGLHGHIKVGPDGYVYLPNKDCHRAGGANAAKGLVVSADNGATWTVHTIPGTTTDNNQSDPSVAIGNDNTIYYGFRDGDHHAKVAVSTDHGSTWSTPFDVGAQLGIQNIQFPAVVAGDAGRAAFSFIGTTTGGSDLNDAFPGTWYLFVSYTYDGGKTWTTVNATPGLPVQRGGVCMQGTACSGSDRNMLDFNDASIDKAGRVLVAYTDGCVGSCEHDSSSGSGKFASVFALVRQDCGAGLFAGTADFAGDPVCPSPKPTMAETGSVAALGAVGALTLLTVSVVIRRRRRTSA